MNFTPNETYHVYNRGNDRQPVFFNDNNYLFFLKKIRTEWKEYCEILCYCLMPNHFHFMLVPNDDGCKNIILGGRLTHMQNLSKTIGKTLSSYTKAINNQNNTTGNLFQKKTKAKPLSNIENNNYDYSIRDIGLTCFHYIHQNPQRANLVKELNQWLYSSYPDYYGFRNGTLCNKQLAMQLLFLSEIDLKKVNEALNENIIQKIF